MAMPVFEANILCIIKSHVHFVTQLPISYLLFGE